MRTRALHERTNPMLRVETRGYELVEVRDAAQLALDIQDAANLQAVITAWQSCQGSIRRDAFARRVNFNLHPVNVLFVSKVSSLMAVNTDCLGSVNVSGTDAFRVAYADCRKLSGTDGER